jgi:hypothetical protein
MPLGARWRAVGPPGTKRASLALTALAHNPCLSVSPNSASAACGIGPTRTKKNERIRFGRVIELMRATSAHRETHAVWSVF